MNGQRLLRIDVQPDACVFRAEIGGAMSPRAAAAIAGGRAEHDILRQVLVQRAQAVADPGAERRMAPSRGWRPVCQVSCAP